ncbi:MFS general substrate transporter [Violaceomyces palustris]|uniref:MFS general substrate transporter n=1 Tax=Violaceomyces palustris TaxID=1673888 RepID=A0ACD0NMW8_9BASI|nr:MFS general substrate transporter [Violaceomyces palustris]
METQSTNLVPSVQNQPGGSLRVRRASSSSNRNSGVAASFRASNRFSSSNDLVRKDTRLDSDVAVEDEEEGEGKGFRGERRRRSEAEDEVETSSETLAQQLQHTYPPTTTTTTTSEAQPVTTNPKTNSGYDGYFDPNLPIRPCRNDDTDPFKTPVGFHPPSGVEQPPPSTPHPSNRTPPPPLSPNHQNIALSQLDERLDRLTSNASGNFSVAAHESGTPLRSWKGIGILAVTSCAQLIDNVLLTAVNIALPSMSKSLGIKPTDTSWLMSSYALAFGGFLLLSGVLADRYGKRVIFVLGCSKLFLWSLAISFARNEVAAIVLRAFQGLGAAATVPAAVGCISIHFQGKDRNVALSLFGGAGAVGFSTGLILGGLIEGSLGWRWIFRVIAIFAALVALASLWLFPKDERRLPGPKPALDIWGAGLGTSGLVLLVFCLSSGGVYGWGKAFIVALLVLSVASLAAFTYAEKRVKNPLMPLTLWRLPNFGASWVCGLFLYCWWQSVVYYLVLLAQNVYRLSPIQTALRLIPIGIISGPACAFGPYFIARFPLKNLVIVGMLGAVLTPIPSALTTAGGGGGGGGGGGEGVRSLPTSSSFFYHAFPTAVMGAIFITLSYTCINVFLITSVPPSAKGLAGGLANTSYQLGSGIGLAITAAVQQAVSKSSTVQPSSIELTSTAPNQDLNLEQVLEVLELLREYKACMWTCSAMAGVALLVILVFVKNIKIVDGTGLVH